MARLYEKARRCGPALAAITGLCLAGEGTAELFAFVDENGHTRFGHESPPEEAVQDVDGLRSLWKGRVTGDPDEPRGDEANATDSSWREVTSQNFRIWLDGSLGDAAAPSPLWALGALEEARKRTASVLGVVPEKPLRVVLYAEDTYAKLHDARFGFETVGFYDGEIHVVAPPNQPDVLGARIHHEYAHAVFRDHVGGDRPYWLNEGWARRFERRLRDEPMLTPKERATLRRRVREGQWISIRKLEESFSSLQRDEAQGAYLQSALAVEWLEEHTGPHDRRRLLQSLREGSSVDVALYEVTGLRIEEFERRLLEQMRATLPDPRSTSGG